MKLPENGDFFALAASISGIDLCDVALFMPSGYYVSA